jgi:5'-deoxynucleotidase YfbR-like HD superfamily hydrolase
MTENLYTPQCIRTFTGQYLNVFDIKPELLIIEDIAHALSRQCRFGGHSKKFYSVAQHCLWVADHCSASRKIEGLLHDASEAYILDFPSPIKESMPEYLTIERSLMLVISQKFGFEYPLSEEVKIYDKMALEHEWENAVLRDRLAAYEPDQAKKLFIKFYLEHKA